MRRKEPWYLFCGDLGFAEECLLHDFGTNPSAVGQASLLWLFSHLGNWSVLEQLLDKQPSLLEQGDARAALLHLRRNQGHPNPWLALLPAAEQKPFLDHWRHHLQQGLGIAVLMSGGLGDQLEGLALLSRGDWLQRLELIFPPEAERALAPLLLAAPGTRQPLLPAWRFGAPTAELPWLSLPALRAVLADSGQAPIPTPVFSHLRPPGKAEPMLLVCWRSKVDPSERFWAHLRSLPLPEIEGLYRWLLPWAAARGWQVADITAYRPEERHRLGQLAGSQQLHLMAPNLGSLADTAHQAARARLVITVDTALIHLAHVLEAPRWLLLHRHPDPRWRERLLQDGGSDREGLRVLQQSIQGRWAEPLQQLRAGLEQLGA